MRVAKSVGCKRPVCGANAVCRQNSPSSGVQASRRNPQRNIRAGCSSHKREVFQALDPLDRPDPGDPGIKLPNQAQSVVQGNEQQLVTVLERDEKKDGGETDYLQELLAIQNNGAKNLGFFGTRNMGFLHQKLVEILSYAMVITGNHVYTSGGTGTNAAVIRGALRANEPELLTVILPQSLERQPEELHELLRSVEQLVTMPENDDKSLLEASRICNAKIISDVQQIICFAFHDSKVLLQTCKDATENQTIVTLCYLD